MTTAPEYSREAGILVGIPFHQIPEQVKQLLDDVKFWIEHQTYTSDEIALRFHHRLVSIHPFPNGNGRHARLLTDLLLERHIGQPAFSWGRAALVSVGEARRDYIEALRAADMLDYTKLLAFVRS